MSDTVQLTSLLALVKDTIVHKICILLYIKTHTLNYFSHRREFPLFIIRKSVLKL